MLPPVLLCNCAQSEASKLWCTLAQLWPVNYIHNSANHLLSNNWSLFIALFNGPKNKKARVLVPQNVPTYLNRICE